MARCAVACRGGRRAAGAKGINVARPRSIRTGTCELFPEGRDTSFVVPLLLFELTLAVVISVGWGMAVLAVLSYRMARAQGAAPWKVIGEHLLIAALVVAATQLVGVWVAATFQDDD